MPNPSPDHDHRSAATAPPPECPAHAWGDGGVQRLYGPEAEADPPAVYEKLRSEYGAVAPVLVHGDLPAWLVLGHQENLDVMHNSAAFSRDSRLWSEFEAGRVKADSPLLPVIAWRPICVYADGMEHMRLRKAVTDSLGRFNRTGLRRHIVRFSNELVDRFAAFGEADFVAQFAEQLPVLVMTQYIGIAGEYAPRFGEAIRDLIKGTETAVTSAEFVTERLRQLVRQKRASPANDLPSWLLGHDANLTDDEVADHLLLILVSAGDFTVNLIADTLHMLLTDPRFRANLSGGEMTLPDAVEQVLWDRPPVSTIPGRWVVADTKIGEQPVKRGDMIMLGLAAGNVDPHVRPDRSVPMHGNRSHLAFSSGPHGCPGQDISRAITQTCIDALLVRLPDVRLAVLEEELRWQGAWLSRRLAELPVTFSRPKSTPMTVSAPMPVMEPGTPRPLPEAEVRTTPANHRQQNQRASWFGGLLRWMRRRP